MAATPAPAALLSRKRLCRILVDSLADRGLNSSDGKTTNSSGNLTNVRLTGPLAASDLLLQYHAPDMFLFPFMWEGSPKVVFEAAACGLTVIARSYQPESVVHGDWYLVDSDDELFAGLQGLLASEALRRAFGVAGRRYAEPFDWDHIAGRWAEIFLKLTRRIRD